jgi:hypothetical protein
MLKLTNVEHAEHDTFIQGNNGSVTLKVSLSENQEDKLDWYYGRQERNANLSESQEDKLVLLRMLQGVLYTTRYESFTNLLSKYE